MQAKVVILFLNHFENHVSFYRHLHNMNSHRIALKFEVVTLEDVLRS